MASLELNILGLVFLNLLVSVDINYYLDKLSQYVDTLNLTLESVRCRYIITNTRKPAVEVLIGLLLMLKAAHEPATDT